MQCCLDCPWCGFEVRYGVLVCRGCNADVVYGATKREKRKAFTGGLVVSLIVSQCASTSISRLRFGPGDIALALGLLVAGGVLAVLIRCKQLRGHPRFFRRTNL